MGNETRLRVWVAAVTGVGIAVTALPPLLAWSDLPETLATRWSFEGTPTGSMRRAVFLMFNAGCAASLMLLVWPRSPAAMQSGAHLVGVLGSVHTLFALVSLAVVRANLHRADWTHTSAPSVAALLAGSALGGLLLYAVSRRFLPTELPADEPASPLDLGATERAYWLGSASNGWLAIAAALAALIGVALLWRGDVFAGAMHCFGGATLELFSKVRVSVDGRSVTIRYGHLGWPKQRVAVDRIVAASTLDVVPMAHGGWGYRGSVRLLRRAAIVVRRGTGLRLELRGQRRLTVTVDDAATAADLINGLLHREGRLHRPEGEALA